MPKGFFHVLIGLAHVKYIKGLFNEMGAKYIDKVK